jgi:ABC-type sugar transport system ATPase subunit
MAAISLNGIEKAFAPGQQALRDVHLSVADGERIVLVGPSGSGKSTLLRIVAGLEQPTAGSVAIDGRDVTGVPPERRDLAMVFQSYALYPHKTVRDNLAFGLRVRRVGPAEIVRRVDAVARSLGLEQLLDRRPAQLSGGQRQRVALGRAIVREPRAFLFDEPLSNLDPQLRGAARAELVELHRRLGATIVYVTHDQEEAMTLGQRIAVLNAGRIEQVATPSELYGRPATRFVAGFVGSPSMNLVDVHRLTSLGLTMGAPSGATSAGFRPHDVRLVKTPDGCAAIAVIEPLGHAQILHLLAGGLRVVAVAPPHDVWEIGETVSFAVDADRVHWFDASGRRLPGDIRRTP